MKLSVFRNSECQIDYQYCANGTNRCDISVNQLGQIVPLWEVLKFNFLTIFLNSCTSSSLAFQSPSECDDREVSADDSKGETACGFCSKQYD